MSGVFDLGRAKSRQRRGGTGLRRVARRVHLATVLALPVCVAALAVVARSASGSAVAALAFAVVAAAMLLLVARVARASGRLARLTSSEARYRALIHHSSDAILIIDPGATIRYASPSAAQVFGAHPRELVGRPLSSLVHAEDATLAARFLEQVIETRELSVVEEWRLGRPDGSWSWTENTGTNLLAEPTVRGIVVNVRDISERRTLEARLTHQAFHDELTHLANRALFLNRVGHAVSHAPRGAHPAAVLFLDLDDFKKVNDSLGHAVGDELLVAAAGRLSACVRPGDTIARLGGDEFAVLLEDVDRMDDVVAVADRIVAAVRTPFRVNGREVFIGVSIGIAAVSLGDTADDVVRNADLAMYFAKGRAKGRHVIYEPSMHVQLMERLELEADLRTAVDHSHFHVEYQPIVHLATGEVYGAEALVRWNHPVRGLVPPSHFVGLAEDTGLIVPIGRAVLMEACGRAKEWRTRRRRRGGLRLSVNLSGRHFQESSLIDDVREALRESGLEPWALTLEITESVLMHQSDTTLAKLRELKALGLSLAIDDFGTGYSSLGYLQRFPIDLLKIDRSFVELVGNGSQDPLLARAIIALGRTLRIETVAEGVERPEQREALRALGCTLGQGFLFAPPMSAEEFGASLADRARTPTVVEMYRG